MCMLCMCVYALECCFNSRALFVAVCYVRGYIYRMSGTTCAVAHMLDTSEDVMQHSLCVMDMLEKVLYPVFY